MDSDYDNTDVEKQNWLANLFDWPSKWKVLFDGFYEVLDGLIIRRVQGRLYIVVVHWVNVSTFWGRTNCSSKFGWRSHGGNCLTGPISNNFAWSILFPNLNCLWPFQSRIWNVDGPQGPNQVRSLILGVLPVTLQLSHSSPFCSACNVSGCSKAQSGKRSTQAIQSGRVTTKVTCSKSSWGWQHHLGWESGGAFHT